MFIAFGALPRHCVCFLVLVAVVASKLSGQSPESSKSPKSEWKPLLVKYCRLLGKEDVTELEEKLSMANDKLRQHVIEVMRFRLQQRRDLDVLRQRLDKLGWNLRGSEPFVPPGDRASISDEDLRVLTTIPFLTRLDLRGTNITDKGLETLAETSIRELSLVGTSVSDEGIRRFVKRIQDRGTNVSNRELEAAGLGIFGRQGIFGGTGLESLDLGGTEIGDESVSHLSQLKDLRTLILSGTNITDGCLPLLAKASDLEVLDVSRTTIGDEGVTQLSQQKNLKTLQLSDTNVTDESLPSLAMMINLEVLTLRGTALTEKGLHHLAELPNLDSLALPRSPPGENAEHNRARHLPRFFPWRASGNVSLHLWWNRWRELTKVDAGKPIRDFRSTSISPDEEMMVVAFTPSYFEDRLRVRTINLQTEDSQELTFEQGQELAFSCPIALSHDAKLLATGAKRSTVKDAADDGRHEIQRFLRTVPVEQSKPEQVTIWRLPNGESEQATRLYSIEAPWPVAKLAFSPNGAHLLVTSRLATEPTHLVFAVVDVVTGELKPIEIATDESVPINQLLLMESLVLSPHGRSVAFSNRHGVGIVDVDSGKVDYLFREAKTLHAGGPIYSSRGRHRHDFSSDGKWLLSTVKVLQVPDWETDRVLIYDLQSRQLTAQIIGRLEAVSGDNATIVTSDINRLSLWHLHGGVPEQFGFMHSIGNPVLSHGGRRLFTYGSPDGKPRFGVWDLQDLR